MCDSDFLDHSDSPKIAWSNAVKTSTGSSIAPGPPSQPLSGAKPRSKTPRKLADKLNCFETSPLKSNGNMAVTVDTLTEAVSREDVDSWDPMAFDHQSQSFNSYGEGSLGALLQNCKESRTNTINLYVGKIPAAITKEGLRNLFSRVGKVSRVYLAKAKTGQNLTFGFVEFSTIKEATTAIQELHNYDIGGGIRLVVKVSETPEQKENRQAKEQSGNILNAALDGVEEPVDTQASEENRLLPRYNSLALQSPKKPKAAFGGTMSSFGSPAAGAASSLATSGAYKQELNPMNNFTRMRKSSSVGSTSSSGGEHIPCHVCSSLTRNRCSLCKTAYCSHKCQKEDWPKHQSECKLIQHGVKPTTLAEPHTPPDDLKDVEKWESDSDSLSDGVVVEPDAKVKALIASIRSYNSPKDLSTGGTKAPEAPITEPSLALKSELHLMAKSKNFKELEGVPLGEIFRQFDCLSELPSIPVTADLPKESPVIVTMYRDATHFSVILATIETKQALKTLQEFGDKLDHNPEHCSADELKEGLLCGYKDQTGAFYRLILLEVYNGPTVLVDLYDFGLRVKVPISSLIKLPEKIASIPCPRRTCSLNHLWVNHEETGGVEFLKSLVAQKPVLMQNVNIHDTGKVRIHCCNVFTLDKKVDINQKIRESRFSDPNPSQSKAASKTTPLQDKGPFGKISWQNDPGNTPFRKVATQDEVWDTTPREKASGSPFKPATPQIKPVGSPLFKPTTPEETGKTSTPQEDADNTPPTSVHENAGHIPFRRRAPRDKALGSPLKPATPRDEGINAPFELTTPQEPFTTPKSDKTTCSQEYTSGIPIQKSTLPSDKTGRTVFKTSHLASLIDTPPSLQPNNAMGTHPPVGRALLQSPPSMLGMANSSPYKPPVGRALLQSPPSMLGMANSSPYKPIHMANKVPFHCAPHLTPLTIIPKVVKTPSIMWAQVMHKNFGQYHEMQRDLNSIYQSSTNSSYSPSVGEMCISKFSHDQSFYRSEVLVVNQNGTVDVQFVDIGNRETVFMGQLHYMKPQFRSFPKQALPFSLAGVGPLDGALTWSEGAVLFLKDKILNRRVQVTILSDMQSTFHAEMYDPEDPSHTLDQVLIHNRLASPIKDFGNPVPPSPTGIVGASVKTSSFRALVIAPGKEGKPLLLTPSAPQMDTLNGPTSSQSTGSFVDHNPSTSPPLDSASATPAVRPTLSGTPAHKTPFVPKATPSAHTNGHAMMTQGMPLLSTVSEMSAEKVTHNDNEWLDESGSSSEPVTPRQERKPSQKWRGDIPHIELEAGSTAKVNVTHVDHPYQFWVLKIDKESVDRFLCMYQIIKKQKLVPISKAYVGDLCLCYFSGDKKIHRARVTAIEDDAATVTYVDYGNSEKVSVDGLYECSSEVLAFEQQAILCTSYNLLNPAGKNTDWAPEAVSFFREKVLDKEVEVNVINCLSGVKHIVEMYVETRNGKKKMLDLMVESGLGGTVGKPHRRDGGKDKSSPKNRDNRQRRESGFSDSADSNTQTSRPSSASSSSGGRQSNQSSSSLGEKQFSPPTCNSLQSKVFKSPLPQVDQEVPANRIEYPKVSDMKGIELQDEMEVLVVEVYHPQHFVVQPACKENADNLNNLSTTLAEHFQSNSLPSDLSVLSVGSLCCANYSEDQLWYRAEVLKKGREIEVYFIDFGNTETVSTQSIAPCPREITDVPICTRKCALGGITPTPPNSEWSQEAKQLLKSLCSQKLLQVKVLDTDSGDVHKDVQLFDTLDGSKDIGAALVKAGLAAGALPKVSDIKSISLPSDEVFNALLTEVVSPSEIYIQLVTDDLAEKFEMICAKLTRFNSSPPPPLSSPPSKGSLCCAKFSDQCWYRAEVLSSSGTACELKFIDFGNKDTVDLKNITACPEEFLTVPCFAVQCGLAGVEPPNRDGWSTECIAHLKSLVMEQLLKAKVVSMDPIPQLILKDSSQKDINRELIQLELAVDTAASRQVQKPLLSKVSDLKKVNLPSCVFQLAVSEVVSPSEMYVQLGTTELAEQLDTLSANLNNKFNSSPPPPLSSPPSKGSLCCAKFSDQCWYRAEVLSTSGTACELKFIDFGNKDTVDLKNMTACPEEFLTAPCFAVQCGLAGVECPNREGWSAECIAHLKRLSEQLLKAKVVSMDPIPQLILKDSSQKDINRELIQLGLAMDTAASRQVQKPLLSKVSDLKRVNLPSCVFQLAVSEVVSPSEMYVQLGTTELAEQLDTLSANLNNKFNSSPPPPLSSPPSKGSLCCAKFSDQCWYRAEVLSSSGTACELKFIDFGNKDTVDLKNITACPEEFLAAPCFAIQCGLAGVEPPNRDGWSTECITHLKSLVMEELLKAKVVSMDPIPQLRLKNASQKDVNQELIQLGRVESNSQTLYSSGPAAGITRSLKSPHVMVQVSTLKKAELPFEAFQLAVSEVVSPSEMYVQVATSELAEMLNTLSSNLNNKLNSSPPLPLSSSPSKGSLCCAKFSDQCWYRAEVLSSSGTACELRFIDFGNKDTVDLKNITACPEEFLTAPCFAVQCKLDGVESPNGDKGTWPHESTALFKSLVLDKLMKAKVIRKDPVIGVPLIKLKDLDSVGTGDVSLKLIQKGWAVYPGMAAEF